MPNLEDLRSSVSELPLRWAAEARGSFVGENKDEFVDVIAAAFTVADEARLSLKRWIDAGRRAGLSWADIGATLGISKQAAQQRFAGAAQDAPDIDGGHIEVRLGATAFNEMRILRDEGRAGRELMGIGPLKLIFRQTNGSWEHRRVVAVSSDEAARRIGPGWTYVSGWLPFHYFKRPVA